MHGGGGHASFGWGAHGEGGHASFGLGAQGGGGHLFTRFVMTTHGVAGGLGGDGAQGGGACGGGAQGGGEWTTTGLLGLTGARG